MKTHTLDITAEHCPMTFVKTKLKLADIPAGDVLEITLRAGEPLENVPRSAAEEGHKVLLVKQLEGDIYRLSIEKH